MTRTQSDHDAFACVRNDLRLLTRSLRRNFEQSITAQGGDTPLYRVQLSSSTGQNKVNGQLGIFSIVNSQATIFL